MGWVGRGGLMVHAKLTSRIFPQAQKTGLQPKKPPAPVRMYCLDAKRLPCVFSSRKQVYLSICRQDSAPRTRAKAKAPLGWKMARKKCEHGRERSRCKECGGSSICEHGRRRTMCKDCGGGSICEHGRRRTQCKDCGGSSICEHGRRRTMCKGCGGGSLCEHGRQRNTCKECGGSSICEHGRRRRQCKDCGGSGIWGGTR